jgi:hypothetical protein
MAPGGICVGRQQQIADAAGAEGSIKAANSADLLGRADPRFDLASSYFAAVRRLPRRFGRRETDFDAPGRTKG